MIDLDQRMQELDVLQTPDLWLSIEARSERPRSFIRRLLDSHRLVPPMQVAAIAVALVAIIGVGVLVTNAGLQEIETADKPGQTENEKAGDDETGGGQTTEGDPAGSDGRPTPRAATGTQGSSSDPRSEEENPAGTGSRDSETASPPVHYTDQADDAYGQEGPPNAALSQREFDILRVDWGPVAYVNEESPGGYSTSMTVAGPARDSDDGAMYVSWAQFGRDCRLYHFLTPGTTAYANGFCDSYSGHPWGFVGRVEGGPVTSTPTQSGGTLLSATFDNRAIPPQLESARTLRNLSAYTCTGRIDQPLNVCDGYLDSASSALTYRI